MHRHEPILSDLEAENALLREQVAALSEQNRRLDARCRALLGETSPIFWIAASDGTPEESPAGFMFTGQSATPSPVNEMAAALHPADLARTWHAWQQAAITGGPFEVEHRLRRYDGVYRWFLTRAHPVCDEPGKVQEWIGWSRDIQEEKATAEALRQQAARIEAEVVQRTEALRRSEAMLAESQRLAQIGSWELDLATLQLTWSEQQFRNFGIPPAGQTISRSLVVSLIDPRDVDRHEAIVSHAVQHGEGFAMDYRVVHPGGEVRHIHSIGQPVFDGTGRPVKMVGTSQDVTERSHLEAQLRAQYDQLMELDQLKNNFVNSVTHELRTPLTSIVGYAEFLDDEIGGPVTHRQREFIHQIQRGAKRLEYLLNDLLDFARMEAGTFTLRMGPADLGDRVREVVESLLPQADETNLALVACLPEGPLDLVMDAQRIGQVLTNLLSNALKFSPRGGAVTVTAKRYGERVRCEVQDEGPGIPAEERARLFQRFSQLEAGVRMGKGAGLGLSISKALVEAHDGTIGVESTPGSGSTFWFELPIEPTHS